MTPLYVSLGALTVLGVIGFHILWNLETPYER